MRWIIYKATCEINQKVYFGLTKKSLVARIRCHKHDALMQKSDLKFHRAIRKYGFESFKWEDICSCRNKSDAEELERYFIKTYNSFLKGYNSTYGGDGFSGDLELKNKIANTLKNKYHKKPSTRIKHSRERGGKPFYAWEQDGTYIGSFQTQIEFCEKFKLSKSVVSRVLKGKKCSYKGMYFSFNREFPWKLKARSDTQNPIAVRVYIRDTGRLAGEYPSKLEAERNLGVSRRVINWYIDGKLKKSPKHPYHFELTKRV